MACQGFADRLAPSASSREDPAFFVEGATGVPCERGRACPVRLFADWMQFDLRFLGSETFRTEYDRASGRWNLCISQRTAFTRTRPNAPTSPRVADV